MRTRAYRICQESTDLGFEKSTLLLLLLFLLLLLLLLLSLLLF